MSSKKDANKQVQDGRVADHQQADEAPRKGWITGYQAEKDSDVWESIAITPAESEDWQW